MTMIPLAADDWCVDDIHVLHGPTGSVRLSGTEVCMLRAFLTHGQLNVDELLPLMSSRGSYTYARVAISNLRRKMAKAGCGSRVVSLHDRTYALLRSESGAVARLFTPEQMTALMAAVAIAERHEPGISARIGTLA